MSNLKAWWYFISVDRLKLVHRLATMERSNTHPDLVAIAQSNSQVGNAAVKKIDVGIQSTATNNNIGVHTLNIEQV